MTLKIKKYLNKILHPVIIFFIILVCILLLLNLFQYGYDSNNNAKAQIDNIILENSVIDSCKYSDKYLDSLNTTYIIREYELKLYPEISNFYCLGKVMDISFDQDIEKYVVYLGTSSYFFNFLNLLINLFLIIVFLLKIFSNKFLLLCNLVFNYFNFYLLKPSLPKIKILIPYINPESNSAEIYFFNLLFLILYVISLKKRYLQIALLCLLLFFIPDYLGIFFLLLLIFDKSFLDESSYNNYQKNILFFIPIAYFASRIVFSLHSIFDNLWLLSGQKVYSGLSRYYDAIWNFEVMSCIHNPNIFDNDPLRNCRELWGGVLDNYIYITTDPNISSLYFMTIMLLIVIVIYLLIQRTRNFNFIHVVLIFISPAINFLTFQGNFDIFYWVFVYLLLSKYPKQYLLISTCLLILSLYKIHAIGAVLGLLFHFFKIRNLNYIILNFIYLIASIFFAIKELLSESITTSGGTVDFSYGLYFLSQYFGNLFTINSNILLILILFLILIFLIYSFILDKDEFIKFKINEASVHYDVLFIWLMTTLAISNNGYRLPIFTLLFLYFLKSDDKLLKSSIVVFLSLSITPLTANFVGGLKIYNLLIYNFIFIKHLAFFVLTYSLSKILLKDLFALFRENSNSKRL